MSASASDKVGVAGVQFKYNGINLGPEDTIAPYSVPADTTTLPNGSYTLTAVARDAAGNRKTSAPVTVTVLNGPPTDTTAPSVSITAPAAGATVTGAMTVTASTSDNVGVVGVQFQFNGTNLGAEDTTAPYSVVTDTRALANGSYSLTADARDAAGNVSTSAAVPITVTNGSTPYSGTPIAVPGTFEAENFDLGGQGVAYHDTTPGNAGGEYRTGEDVDLFVSNDATRGGYIVKNFDAGEWLAYTISVATMDLYDIELRVATQFDFPDAAFRIEIDGADVTGTVVLPDTGGWDHYQWAGKRTVVLAAGTHVLKVVSEQPYFAFDAIRVTVTPPPPTPDPSAVLFFCTFPGAPTDCGFGGQASGRAALRS